MDYKDITSLLVKVAGAVIVAFTLSNIPAFLSYYYSSTDRTLVMFLTTAAFPLFAPLIAGTILFWFPATISNKIVRGEKIETPASFFLRVEAIAIAILGLYLLSRGLVDAVYHIIRALRFYQLGAEHLLPTGSVFWQPDTVASFVATGFELVLALWFIFGAPSLAVVMGRLRYRGA